MLSLRLRVAGLALGSVLALLGCSRVHLGNHDGGGGDRDGGGAGEPCGDAVCAPGDVCCSPSCGICTPPGGACPAIECTDECFGNGDCGPGEYCRWGNGSCGSGAPGVCAPRPDACPTIIAEACGCDGRTYGNECEANRAGVSVLHDGVCDATCAPQDAAGDGLCDAWFGWRWSGSACEGVSGCSCVGADCGALYSEPAECEAAHAGCVPGGSCLSSAECGPGRYCHFAIGECSGSGDGLGDCRAIPGELPCPSGAPPVCGCDGVSYACEAAANQVGVSALHEGACGGPCAPMDAFGEGLCAAYFGVKWNGTACEGVGGCSCAGADCDRLFSSEAECMLAYTGCPGSPGGPCGGFPGYVCRSDEWCDFEEPHYCGGADEIGICRPRPSVCPDVIDPACGCDGVLYNNSCEANVSGVDTLGSASSCGVTPGG